MKQVSAGALEEHARNQELASLNARLRAEVDDLTEESQRLESNTEQRWLLIGGGTGARRNARRRRHQSASATQRLVVIELSVNLNKIALLRNSRGGDQPSVLEAADIAIGAGAYGITVHPRPDQRHVRPHDVTDLAQLLRARHRGIEFNIEGNPFAGARDNGYPGFDALIESARPDQCTLVPDGDNQLTSDHGWDLSGDTGRLGRLRSRAIKASAPA